MSKLKKYRQLIGLTQKELSDKSGVCYWTIVGQEKSKGHRINISDLKILKKLADVLNVNIIDIIEDNELIDIIKSIKL